MTNRSFSTCRTSTPASLFWLIHGLRGDLQSRIDRGDQRETEAVTRTRDDLAEFKLAVARTYVPLSLIRDVDQRLSQQLLRIEAKLDEVALTQSRPPRGTIILEDIR